MHWGFRTLAYPIHKRHKAHYVYFIAQLYMVKELERFLSVELHEGVFRHLVLIKDQLLGTDNVTPIFFNGIMVRLKSPSTVS